MTPSLFDLPLRLGDALTLAGILIETCGSNAKPVTDDLRNRVNARAGGLRLAALRPYPASLERDPIHPSAYYICVDGVENQPLLLRVAPSTTPSSGLFPKAILIGRTRVAAVEVVLNAIPFGPADGEAIKTFSEKINKAFQPRSAGSRPVICVRSSEPALVFPLAFAEFRKLLRSSGQNQAAFGPLPDQDPAALHSLTVWSAIRSGWREGYALESPKAPLGIAREVVANDSAAAAQIGII